MFQFPAFTLSLLFFKQEGCPIRTSTDQCLFAAPRGFSQLTTSFVVSESLGIPHTPLFASYSLRYTHVYRIVFFNYFYLICSVLFFHYSFPNLSMNSSDSILFPIPSERLIPSQTPPQRLFPVQKTTILWTIVQDSNPYHNQPGYRIKKIFKHY